MKRFLSAFFVLGIGANLLTGQTPPKPRGPRLLQASGFASYLRANRVSCLISSFGDLCGDDRFDGSIWPQGTPNRHIFNSGLQIAGIIPSTAGGGKATFPWAGDTTGAFFVDFRGNQHVQRLSEIFDSRDTADLRLWPNAAFARDSSVFHPSLIGRNVISDQDLWTRYWEGNPNYLNGRTHPMGVVVDQRAMAFNAPRGNEDIVYFVFTVYNVTARNASIYTNPTLDPALRSEIAAIGEQFQDSAEQQLGVSIPDAGYRIDSVYVGLAMDPDIGDFSRNYSNLILPFDVSLAYQGDFQVSFWEFPAEIFGPPFAKAPGFVGARFVKSPARELAMFSNFTGSATGFPDPVGVLQLWRYLSGNVSPAYGDNPCTFGPDQQARHYCFLRQDFTDTRFFQSTGPFSLDPGETKTIVLAYVFAAPTPAVEPYIGGDLKPGIPFPGDSIAADTTKIRVLERAAGWMSQTDANGNGVIEEHEVTTLPRSLLDKARVARAVADNKFLLPSAPGAPSFFLIPGDDQVTVVWQKSPSETSGDPYFAIASDPTSALYDPNFRSNDVEGYRIYRGRNPSALQVVAQFDYAGTSLIDYTGTFLYPGECAPELGVLTDCPNFATGAEHGLYGSIVQVPPGGRVLLNGNVFIERTDTAVTGGGSGFPGIFDTGVNFVFVDRGVRNSFSYLYAVTAFDVNSLSSGPSSLESPRFVKGVTPRAASGQETAGVLGTMQLLAADGRVLDSATPLPTLNGVTGIFSGAMPPTDGLSFLFSTFVPEVLADSAVTLTIDSIVPGAASIQRPAVYYLSAGGVAGPEATLAVPINLNFFSSSEVTFFSFAAAGTNVGQAARFGGDSTFSLYAQATVYTPGTWRLASWGRASLNGEPPFSDQAGPRWWAGAANENTAAPNELQCTPANGPCVQPDLSRNAGRLPGVTTLFHLQAYSTVPNTPMRELEGIGATVARAADFRLYWSANGRVDSVIDVTHGVPVPFQPGIGPSWGFLTDSSFLLGGTDPTTTADLNSGLLTWSDAFCVAPVPAYLSQCGGATQRPAVLQNHARLSASSATSSTYAGTSTLSATGNGFILYLNGHFFLMQLATLPAAGTVWHARFFAGAITGTAAAGNYVFHSDVRPPAVPGLVARLTYTGSRLDPSVTSDTLLRLIHTVPDPYYVTNALETDPKNKVLKFVRLPAQAIVRIYSASGILVRVLTHNDPTGGGETTWDLRSREGRLVASGVYFYHVETPDRRQRVGRFTIVMFRP
jgi:hypothetical protein